MLPVLLSIALSAITQSAPARGAASARDILVWLVTDRADSGIARGVRMGAEEMARTAALLGRRFVLRQQPYKAGGAIPAEPSSTGGTMFVIADLDEREACEVAQNFTARDDVLVLNPRVQAETCPASHLSLRLPQGRRTELLARSGTGRHGLRLDEWHASLGRFGAQELNERYQHKMHEAMDGDAWAGWFATKMAAESALRLKTVTRRALVGSGSPAFDGHKGVPLRFDEAGLLRQPVYIIDGSSGSSGTVVKEIP